VPAASAQHAAAQAAPPAAIAGKLLRWFERHGRHDLPWQHPRSPYRVWVAEIMLQQTQVQTVVRYFERFMARFPDVQALAAADQDTVMRYWAGLGYYARARNLHATAQQLVAQHGGVMPAALAELQALPGIGRSTAGAIRAQAFDLWAPILDGNARRVLARVAAIQARPGTARFDNSLWPLAEQYTPTARVADYTQAIMDLGALVCTRRSPLCGQCPLRSACLAYRFGLQDALPAPRRRAARPQRQVELLLITDSRGRILLHKRPPAGIWGGLWSLPEVPAGTGAARHCREQLGLHALSVQSLAPLRHAFTHFELEITPLRVQAGTPTGIMDAALQWHAPGALPGLPAPIRRIIKQQFADSAQGAANP